MSDLPDRDSLNTYTIEDWPAKQDVLAAYKYGVLRSRDEMNEEAAARRWFGIDVYYMPYSEAVKNLLDAAWGVADEV